MLRFKDGRVQVYPCGSEEQIRWELALEDIFELDRLRLERLLQKKSELSQHADTERILAVPDQKIVYRRQRPRLQRYRNSGDSYRMSWDNPGQQVGVPGTITDGVAVQTLGGRGGTDWKDDYGRSS